MQVFESVGVDLHTGFRLRGFAWCVLALRSCGCVRVSMCALVSVRVRTSSWLGVDVCGFALHAVFAACICLLLFSVYPSPPGLRGNP